MKYAAQEVVRMKGSICVERRRLCARRLDLCTPRADARHRTGVPYSLFAKDYHLTSSILLPKAYLDKT